jgi:UDP-glucose 4-epimerase
VLKILVTGGAGFIGSHIVDGYIAAGHDVVVLDDLSTGTMSNVNRRAKFVRADIRDSIVARLFEEERFDAVNHQAGRGNVRLSLDAPMEYADVNILGGINLLQSCVATGVTKFIYASTGGCVFGELDYAPADEDHPIRPVEPYGASKACFEVFLSVFGKLHALNYTILRYPNVYGPRQNPDGEAGVVSIFSKRMALGQLIIVNGDGEQQRDYLYVEDAVRANLAVLVAGHKQVFNLGWGVGVTVNEICTRLKAAACYRGDEQHGPPSAGELRRSMLDASRIHESLGWKPMVSLDDGLARTYNYVREQLQSNGSLAVGA